MKLLPNQVTIGIILITGVLALIFIFLSRDNRLVFEIIFGSIIFTLLLGVISALSQNYFDTHFSGEQTSLSLIAICLLIVLIAFLVYAANNPQQMNERVQVMYLLDDKEATFPSGLSFSDSRTSICYANMCEIFKQYKESDSVNAQKALAAFNNNVLPADTLFLDCMHNLTVYLVAYYLGHHFTTEDMEVPSHLGESRNRLGWPHLSIEGKHLTLGDIVGQIDENPFFGLIPFPPSDNYELSFRMPHKTQISFENVSRWHSQYIIKNPYVAITITIRNRIMSDNVAFLHRSQLYPSPTSSREYYAYRRIDVPIYVNVAFSKYRYGFPAMRHYEQWSEDLLKMLENKFGWGTSSLANAREVSIYFESLLTRHQNSNEAAEQ